MATNEGGLPEFERLISISIQVSLSPNAQSSIVRVSAPARRQALRTRLGRDICVRISVMVVWEIIRLDIRYGVDDRGVTRVIRAIGYQGLVHHE